MYHLPETYPRANMAKLVRALTREPDELASSGLHQKTWLVELIILRGNLTYFGPKLKNRKSDQNQNFGFLVFLLELQISKVTIIIGN